MDTRAVVYIKMYDTDARTYDALRKVFGERESNGTRWVAFQTIDGVEVTFFAADHVETGDPA